MNTSPRRRRRKISPRQRMRAIEQLLKVNSAGAVPLTRRTIANIVADAFLPLVGDDEFASRTVIADNNYLSVEPNWLVNSIITDPILAPQQYRDDIFDCDDYVMYFKSKMSLYAAQTGLQAPLAVGYLITVQHAFNFCITEAQAIAIINTQSQDRAVVTDSRLFLTFLQIDRSNHIQTVYI